MDKWEYCVLGPIKDVDNRGLIGDYPAWIYFTLDGPKKAPVNIRDGGNEPTVLAKAIAQLGLEGWELVGVGDVGADRTSYHVLYFKRLVQ